MLSQQQMDSLAQCLTAPNLASFDYLKSLSFDPALSIEFNFDKPRNQQYIYIRTSAASKVLAVAHTDWVLYSKPKMNYAGNKVWCPQLDDRLGVWLITSHLLQMIDPKMPYDILLTDLEESSQSTARCFVPPKGKQYNWMFEFDRKASEVVMYGYETPDLKKLMQSYGFKVGLGSFTDICNLTHLNCAGFNFGTGYHGEHSQSCYADLRETFDSVGRFLPFYHENYILKLKHNHEEAEKKRDTHERWKNPSSHTTNGSYSGRGTNQTQIGFYTNHHTDTKSESKGKKSNPFSALNLVDRSPEAEAFRSAIKDKKTRDMLLSAMDKSVKVMTDAEYRLYCKYVVPLKRNKRQDSQRQTTKPSKGLVSIVPTEDKLEQYKTARAKVASKEWSEARYQQWLKAMIAQQDDETLQEDIKEEPFIDLREIDKPEWDRLWYKYSTDPTVWEEGLTFDEWYKGYLMDLSFRTTISNPTDNPDTHWDAENDDDTVLILSATDSNTSLDDLEPTDEELAAITDDEIKELVMKDPMFSSTEFPGGKESRDEYIQSMKGLA
jgi:hypothetical protein